MGRWHDGEGGLAHCEGIRQAHRSGEVGAARSETLCRLENYAESPFKPIVVRGFPLRRLGIVWNHFLVSSGPGGAYASTVDVLRSWLREPPRGRDDIVFPNARGGRLSADGAQYLLAKHLATARQNCLSLREKRVTLHVLRHTTAMALLQGGVDTSSIALWLGHESPATTHIYLDANLAFKEKILGRWRLGMERKRDVTVRQTPS